MAQKETWEIILTRPAEKAYDKSSAGVRQRLDRCFEDLEENPFYGGNIKLLTGQLKGLYRYRVGDWRIIYQLYSKKLTVEVIAILPRGGAYK